METRELVDIAMGGATIPLSRTCPFCGKVNTIHVMPTEFADYLDGMIVQVAFKSLSKDEREIVLTGICNDCWPACDYDETDAEVDDYRRHGYDL